MNPTDPYPVLLLLRAHLEGRMRQGERRLWLQPDATQALRELVRMKPQPWPAGRTAAAEEAEPCPAAEAAPAAGRLAEDMAVELQRPVSPAVRKVRAGRTCGRALRRSGAPNVALEPCRFSIKAGNDRDE